jgi:two-component system chemotaxis sensor kinase CheA
MGGLSPESLAAIRIVFFQECEQHLAEIGAGLRALQGGDRDPETVNGVFRAVHSVRGGAGIFALDALVRFSDRFEAALAEVRAGRLELGPDILRVLLRADELLAELVEEGREGRTADPSRTAPLLEELASIIPERTEPSEFGALNFEPRTVVFQPLDPAGRIQRARFG